MLRAQHVTRIIKANCAHRITKCKKRNNSTRAISNVWTHSIIDAMCVCVNVVKNAKQSSLNT